MKERKRPRGKDTNGDIKPGDQLGLSAEELSLLQACELGDIQQVLSVIKAHPTVNVDCVDLMGRTPLQITVEREDKDLMEVLLPLSSKRNVEFTLLDAINDKKESIACAILRHPVYASPEFQGGGQKGFAETTSVLTKFHPDTTPLVLAAQRNLYELVKVLVMSGDRIERPHPYLCNCHTCIVMAEEDQLRYAQRRLNAYKGLSSESYLSLANEDPLLEAFRLGREMKQIGKVEKHFKTDYAVIAEALSEFVVKVLDRVRDNQELEMILNKVDDAKGGSDEFEPAARIKMAVINKEKKFVAHPSCQMTLANMWYGHIRHVERAPLTKKILYFICFLLFYPFMALLYIFLPKAKIMVFMTSPLVKFMAQTYSYIAFISFIISWTFTLSPASSVKLEIPTHTAEAKVLFKEDEHIPGNTLVRFMTWEFEEWMILVWVIAFLWQECKQLHQEGPRGHLRSMYNVLDFAMIALYMCSYSLKGVSIYKAQHSVIYFKDKSSFSRLMNNDSIAIEHHYWITPDRFYWDKFDPYHVSEGIFAIANVLTFSRISAMLPVNDVLGPMQISLGRMLNDILRFMMIFLLIIVAFMVGLDNLYWFYDASVVTSVSLKEHGMTKGGENFGNIEYTFRSVFWGMFGLMDYDIVDLAPYDAIFTRNVGYILYGCYIICIVIVLLNMLIAMMSLSFQQIADDSDVEWKFARSKLYLEYIEDGQTLPPPLNIIPTPKAIWRICKQLSSCCKGSCRTKPIRNNKTNEIITMNNHEISFLQRPDYAKALRNIQERKETNGGSKRGQTGQNITGSPNMTLVYGFIPIYHDNESNGTFLDHKGLMEKEAKPTYKDMMAKVVERFVYDMTTGGEGDTEDELDGLRQEVIFLRRHLVTSMELQDKQLKECRGEINELKNALVGLNSAQTETYSLSVDVGTKTQQALGQISQQLEALAQNQGTGWQGFGAMNFTDLSYVEWARMRSIPPPVPGSTGLSHDSMRSAESLESGPPERWVDDPPYINHR